MFSVFHTFSINYLFSEYLLLNLILMYLFYLLHASYIQVSYLMLLSSYHGIYNISIWVWGWVWVWGEMLVMVRSVFGVEGRVRVGVLVLLIMLWGILVIGCFCLVAILVLISIQLVSFTCFSYLDTYPSIPQSASYTPSTHLKLLNNTPLISHTFPSIPDTIL